MEYLKRLELRRSGASGPHPDKRKRRLRTRQTERKAAIEMAS